MAKKTESIREKRERENRESKANHREEARARSEKEKKEEAAKALSTQAVSSGSNEKKGRVGPTKKYTKANGLKSVFVVEDKHVLTSFGHGYQAELETEFVGDEQKHISEPGHYTAAKEPPAYQVQHGKMKPGQATIPSGVRDDLIGARKFLEQRYFGRTFKDNIHIQSVYNILDLEKVLAFHIDNIIYSINNVFFYQKTDERGYPFDLFEKTSVQEGKKGSSKDNSQDSGKGNDKDEGVQDDIQLNLDDNKDLAELCKSDRLSYFGSAFMITGDDIKAKAQKTKARDKTEIVYMLELLGRLRHFLKHGGKKWLYNLNKELPVEYQKFLNTLYQSKVNSLNKGFAKHNAKNIQTLKKALGITTSEKMEKMVVAFYNFIVKKEGRNVGFTLTKIRELLIQQYMTDLTDKSYDSVRSKIYRLSDFVIYTYYAFEPTHKNQDDLVNKLRESMTEEEKDRIYQSEAQVVWQKMQGALRVVKNSDYTTVAETLSNEEINTVEEQIAKARISGQVTLFTELMYMLTLFLDGKEINTLLCDLINKLENIQGFVDVLRQLQLPLFQGYDFFVKSGEVAEELRVMKSFARMEKPLPSNKWVIMEDALALLGLKKDEVEKERENVYGTFDKETKKMDVKNKALRNFIFNNIIDSSRFHYILRLANPECVRGFAKNKALVSYVLNKVPDTQLQRYYQSCIDSENRPFRQTMIESLAKMISELSFEDLRDIKKGNSEFETEKIKKKAMLSLYLTVLYQITKNLVNVNARYTIALHCLERDTKLCGFKALQYDCEEEQPDRPCQMTKRYIDERKDYGESRKKITWVSTNGTEKTGKPFNWHLLTCIDKNYKKYTQNEEAAYHAFRLYRNAIAHLTAVTSAYKYAGEMKSMTGYFELYHYVMQRYLQENETYRQSVIEKSGQFAEWAEKAQRFNTFQKDWLWILNVPFAYNPVRYKNLSMARLFDKNEQPENNSDEEKEI